LVQQHVRQSELVCSDDEWAHFEANLLETPAGRKILGHVKRDFKVKWLKDLAREQRRAFMVLCKERMTP